MLPYQRKKDYYKKLEQLKQKVETKNIVNSKWLLGQIETLGSEQ